MHVVAAAGAARMPAVRTGVHFKAGGWLYSFFTCHVTDYAQHTYTSCPPPSLVRLLGHTFSHSEAAHVRGCCRPMAGC